MKSRLILLFTFAALMVSCGESRQISEGQRFSDGIYVNKSTCPEPPSDYVPSYRSNVTDRTIHADNVTVNGPCNIYVNDPWYSDPWFRFNWNFSFGFGPYWDPFWRSGWYPGWGPGWYPGWYPGWGPVYPVYPVYYSYSRSTRNPVYGSGYTPYTHSGGMGTVTGRRSGTGVYYGGRTTDRSGANPNAVYHYPRGNSNSTGGSRSSSSGSGTVHPQRSSSSGSGSYGGGARGGGSFGGGSFGGGSRGGGSFGGGFSRGGRR